MYNLYQAIMALSDQKSAVCEELASIEHSIPVNKKLRNELYDQCDQLERKIKKVENKYKITIKDIAVLLKRYTGVDYKVKIFTEYVPRRGENTNTYQYVACFINKAHTYYNKKTADTIYLFPEEYNNMLRELSSQNSIVFSSRDKIDFDLIDPSLYLNSINFIYLFTRGHVDGVITSDFVEQHKAMIRKSLENVNIVVKEDNVSQEV